MRPPISPLVFIAAALLGLVAPRPAQAQFETPNRSFHNATAFRLDGKHQAVPCESCHLNGQYPLTPKTCFECHWIRRRDDRYQTRLGTQCENCHRPISWTAVRWDHGAQAGVPLNQDHRILPCQTCHPSAEFKAASVTCIGCHQQTYAATQTPNHLAAGFPTTCEACHRPGDATWRNTGTGAFSHSSTFPLVGAHATQTCRTCHVNNVYKGTPRECAGCHLERYNRTQSPNHAAAGFSIDCVSCHRPTDPSWGSGGGFNHGAAFALVGTHATQSCAACHKNGVFKGTPRECVGCHQPQYNATRNPNHAAAGFPTTCESCHRPTDPTWASGTGFNHNAVFALVGVHATKACAACHVSGVYRGTPRSCVGCHQAQYNATRSPNHAAAGFPTSCESCHRATDPSWSSGTGFNHNTVFALVGVHATKACSACHVNNVYRGTPRRCVGCHQTQYTRTRDPNHVAAGFPTTCETCHRAADSSWTQGRFTHSRFPLSGRHNVACAQCHTAPSNFKVFSCTTCHSRSDTDSEHRERPGYVYESNACYSCHPNGKAD